MVRAVIEHLEARRLFNAAGFSDTIDNPYFPLAPGMTWLYKGTKDGAVEKNRIVVQNYTKKIKGVICTVVLDRVYEDGNLSELTHDWYAQDNTGNVWYFGEASKDIENGNVVSTQGSWQAGVNGARAGIVMEARPTPGDVYQQEFSSGVAQDRAKVLALHAKTTTGLGTLTNLLKTEETTPLEPGTAEVKYYRKGIGFVRSQTSAGPERELLKLVSFKP